MALHVVQLEDEFVLRDILKCTVEAYDPGILLRQFADSDSIVAYIQATPLPVDLFIIDIRVPGSLDGLGVTTRLREMGCTGKVLLTSALRRPDDDLFRSLDCEWAGKPWSPIDLIAQIQQLARGKAQASRIR